MGACRLKCVQYMFMGFNFVFWITGLVLLTVGVLMKTAFADFMKLSTEIDYNTAPYIMVGCGCFIVLVGFCGCWASMKHIQWALRIYMGILGLLFVCELGGGIYGYVIRNKLSGGLTDGFTNGVTHYNQSSYKTVIDKFQTTSKCCGVNAYTDWNVTLGNNKVPKSCCKDPKACAYDDLSKGTSTIYTNGCVSVILEFVTNKLMIIGGVGVGIAVFQLLGVACAYCLVKIEKEETPYENM